MADPYLKHAGVWMLQMIAVLFIAGVIGFYLYAPLAAILTFFGGGVLLLRQVAYMIDGEVTTFASTDRAVETSAD